MPEPESPYSKSLGEWYALGWFQRTVQRWLPFRDHYRRPRQPRRLLLGLCIVALLIGAGWPAFAYVRGQRRVFQSRSVSTAHAMFNERCEVCHTGGFEPALRLWPGNATLLSVSNTACLQCHDGPIHKDAADLRNCVSCHREHRGHETLARMNDAHCTECHATLRKADGSLQAVSSFPDAHPDFGLIRRQESDRAAVSFNHAVHLKEPGVRNEKNETEKLACTQCHQADDAGRYMKPISYAENCKRCHELSVRLVGVFKDETLNGAAEAFAAMPAPHEPPATIQAALRERLIGFVHEHPKVMNAPTTAAPPRPIPGWQRPQAVSEKEWDWTTRQLAGMERLLFDAAGGCKMCHSVVTERNADQLPIIADTNIPKRWLKESFFSHRRHQMMECTACHAQAPTSTRTSDVLLTSIRTCGQCHTPSRARSDCVECHRYHDWSKEHAHPKRSLSDILGLEK